MDLTAEKQTLPLRPGILAHASGALFIEGPRTLLIADAHLGYGFAQRRRGQLGPTTDGGIAEQLFSVVSHFQPAEVVFLGDTVHAPKPSAPERAHIESTLQRLLSLARITNVQGNHDRAFTRDFGHLPMNVIPQWRHEDLLAIHGDRLHIELPEAGHTLIGHLHPAVGLRDAAGAKRRLPAFLTSPTATILPAFSPFAAGFDIMRLPLPKEIRQLLGPYEVIVSTGRRIARLSPQALKTIRND